MYALQYNVQFLLHTLFSVLTNVYTQYALPIVRKCKSRFQAPFGREQSEAEPEPIATPIIDFLPACANGDLKTVQYYVERDTPVNLNDALGKAVTNNQTHIVSYLLDKGAGQDPKILNECLKVACANNSFALVELLIKRGADPTVAKRYARSNNILRMVYRIEQKSEMIN